MTAPIVNPEAEEILTQINKQIFAEVKKRPFAGGPGYSILGQLIAQLEAAEKEREAWKAQAQQVTIERNLLQYELDGVRESFKVLFQRLGSFKLILKATGKLYVALVGCRRLVSIRANYEKPGDTYYEVDGKARDAIDGYLTQLKKLHEEDVL